MLVPSERSVAAWTLISLDGLEVLWEALWLDVIHVEAFCEAVREQLSTHLEEHEIPFEDMPLVNAYVWDSLHGDESAQVDVPALIWWVRNVFTVESEEWELNDRFREREWHTLMSPSRLDEAAELPVSTAAWIRKLLVNLDRRYKREAEEVDKRLAAFDHTSLSSWDQMLLEKRAGFAGNTLKQEVARLRHQIRDICTLNRFVDIWDDLLPNTSFAKMEELHKWIVAIDPEGFRSWAITWPGSWKIELDQYRPK